jgi:hypothetical protein
LANMVYYFDIILPMHLPGETGKPATKRCRSKPACGMQQVLLMVFD